MWLYLIGGVVVILAGGFLWGVLHLRHSQSKAYEEMSKVKLEDIPGLCQGCIDGFKTHFDEVLDLDQFEHSAQVFSNRLDQHESLKRSFAEDEFYWKYVLPTGAFLGEMLRLHAGGRWELGGDGGAPIMKIPAGNEEATTYPFDKIMKHAAMGDPGDIYAFFQTSLSLEQVVAQSGET